MIQYIRRIIIEEFKKLIINVLCDFNTLSKLSLMSCKIIIINLWQYDSHFMNHEMILCITSNR
jgi:hypothetical protein